MHQPSRIVRHALAFALAGLVSGPVLLSGCLGRSVLEDANLADGGGAAGSGGSSGTGGGLGGTGGGLGGTGGGASRCLDSCAGCCDLAGVCRPGGDIFACGVGGVDCLDCGALGFGCTSGQCVGEPPKCSPSTCPGCCDDQGMCRPGSETNACGASGGACVDCGGQQQGCVAGTCQGAPPTCGPSNCGGCCDANGECREGSADGTCGAGGVACSNCSAQGRKCNQPGSYCAFIPTCGSVTCPSGCCDAKGACRDGRADHACGAGGQICSDCSASSRSCAPQGFCYQGKHCGPDNCAGCCTATGECVPGSASEACGQYGALCDNCSTQGEACQGQVCRGSSTCPMPYAGCNPSLVTTPPKRSKSCSASALEGLAKACGGDGTDPACGDYFSTLLSSSPACYDCVLQFTGDQAYTRCLAPYLDAACNHALSCAVDCSGAVCSACSSAASQSACEEDLYATGGECQRYLGGYYCAQAAIDGPASFCTFAQGEDVGEWFLRVATRYCGG